jgi:hypothetical protein
MGMRDAYMGGVIQDGAHLLTSRSTTAYRNEKRKSEMEMRMKVPRRKRTRDNTVDF